MNISTYPEISVNKRGVDSPASHGGSSIDVELRTRLRVFHLGHWYYQNFMARYYNLCPYDLTENVVRFHSDVYLAMHFGVVDLKAVDMFGKKVWGLCEDQRDEADRLKAEFRITAES